MSIITQWLSDIFSIRRLTLTTIFANVDNLFAKELQTTIFASDIEIQYPSIFAININRYQPISINIHQSLPATRRAPPLCPCAPNTVVDIVTCDLVINTLYSVVYYGEV